MSKNYTRKGVLQRLHATLNARQVIIAAGAGTGISAKFIERGGADLIVVYNSGRFRMMGHPSSCGMLPYGDANAIVMEMGEREILPVVQETPVIAGVCGTDPTRRMAHFLQQVRAMGFSGVINFPTVGVIDGQYRRTLEEVGLGYDKEVEMIRLAQELDLFTMAYVFNEAEAQAMAKVGVDVVVAHMRTTLGGFAGPRTATSLENAIKKVQAIAQAATQISSEVLTFCHGGPISTPEEAAKVITHTDAVGFVGASSIERLTTEKAIQSITEEFKRICLRG